MIQANDLRLNNIISLGGLMYKVALLSNSEIQAIPLSGNSFVPEASNKYSYALLTEELMQRISGNDSGNLVISSLERTSDSSDMITLSTIECYLHEDGFLRVCAYEYDKHPDGSMEISDDVITLGYEHLQYVHQLQNLYFSLTGRELEVAIPERFES